MPYDYHMDVLCSQRAQFGRQLGSSTAVCHCIMCIMEHSEPTLDSHSGHVEHSSEIINFPCWICDMCLVFGLDSSLYSITMHHLDSIVGISIARVFYWLL